MLPRTRQRVNSVCESRMMLLVTIRPALRFPGKRNVNGLINPRLNVTLQLDFEIVAIDINQRLSVF